jgi:isopenicillin-N epimerase
MTVSNVRDLFLLDPDVVYLNHGSFGACPKPVFEVYQYWQRELERQPVAFFAKRLEGLMAESRQQLGEYLGTAADNLIYLRNATAGVNTVAHSLNLQPDDEVLTTDHEYGACDSAMQFVCDRAGAKMIRQHIPLPLPSDEEIVELILSAVTPRTRLLFLSHITSATGLILPILELIRRARESGILTLIDGAHVPGQLDFELDVLGADFYTGNCHKWMCTPKGSAFLYVRPEHQAAIHPLVISWGYNRPGVGYTTDEDFVTRHELQGTLDPAAYLSIPAAIEFMSDHDWSAMRQDRHALAAETQQRLCDLTDSIIPVREDAFAQMCLAPLPVDTEQQMIKSRLIDDYHIEVPINVWQNRTFVRVSFQVYNTREDADALLKAVAEILDIRG